jgi:hypothetical protein
VVDVVHRLVFSVPDLLLLVGVDLLFRVLFLPFQSFVEKAMFYQL